MLAGRQGDLRELLGSAEDARRGRGALVLVGGEPGIGKTRLATEVRDRLRGDGFVTAWVTCREDAGTPPYWPWSRLLGQLGAPDVVGGTGPGGRRSAEPERDPELARFLLFESVIDRLRSVAGGAPLLMVLDDLHWMDEPSLRLLAALAAELATSAILVLGTYRDTEPNGERLLATLPAGPRLGLGGLSPPELDAALLEVTGERLDPELAGALHARTAGNPYFAAEVVRLLRADGRLPGGPAGSGGVPIPLPDTVRTVLERRLARLPTRAHELLHVLALLGEPVRMQLAVEIAEVPAGKAAELAQAAVGARLLTVADGEHRFAHPLVRQTLVAQLGTVRRLLLHQRIGDALAGRVDGGLAGPGEVANHLLAAARLGAPAGEAVRWAVTAARAAVRRTAYEDAVALLRAALAVGEGGAERAELLCALGAAALACGDREGAGEAYREASGQARRLGRPDLLAVAALGLTGGEDGFEIDLRDPNRIAVLTEALDASPECDHRIRVALLSRLSLALSFTGAEPRRRELADAAVAMARRLAEPAALARALAAYCDAAAGPDQVAERRAAAAEIVTLAGSAADRPLELLGRRLRVVALAEAGDWPALDVEIENYARLADRLGQPRLGWYVPLWRAARALMRGDGEALAAETDRLAGFTASAGDSNVELLAMVQRWVWLVGEGRVEAIYGEFARLLTLSPGGAVGVTCSWAFVEAHRGQREEARRLLDQVVDGIGGLPVDSEWLPAVAQTAVAAVLAGHRAAAELTYRLLAPCAGLQVIEGILAASWGSVDAHLGRLAAFLGRPAAAREHFAAAVRLDAAAGAALAERTRRWIAEPEPRAPEPRAAAEPLAPQPIAPQPRAAEPRAAEPRAAEPIAPQPRAVEPWVPASRAPASPQVAPGEGEFHQDGQVWTIRYSGRTVRLKHSKGLGDLAVLLGRPGEQTHVAELAGGVGGPVDRGDAGPMADRRAVAAYRERLRRLERELERAAGDEARACRVEAERAALLAELRSVTGIGGRPRRAASDTERMRKAVGNRVRQAIDRIGEAHPELARHLRASVRTGTWCGYRPEHPVRWHVSGARRLAPPVAK